MRIIAAVLLILGLAACGTAEAAEQQKITLVVDTFGSFGYDDLYEQYQKENPHITIEVRNADKLDEYWPKLTQYLAAGDGAGDIVALEEGIIAAFSAYAPSFVDLRDYGANEVKDQFLAWKWDQGTGSDGRVFALGTDVGSLAMCYRTDLFAKAGLPTDRDQVSALWPDWAGYQQAGLRFTRARTGAAFYDSSVQIFNSMLMQAAAEHGDVSYFDKDNQLVIETNPAVKQTWDRVTTMISQGLSARLAPWSEEWTAGFAKGAFATIACPSWMLGVIKNNAGDAGANKWDVAAIPGGGGNWGGSFLAVPRQSRHRAEAAALALWLTSPSSHITAFKTAGGLPSDTVALADPELVNFTNPYFNSAPVGRIFGDGAKKLKPVFLGIRHQDVREQAVEPALKAVEAGELSAAAGWRRAVAEAKKKGI